MKKSITQTINQQILFFANNWLLTFGKAFTWHPQQISSTYRWTLSTRNLTTGYNEGFFSKDCPPFFLLSGGSTHLLEISVIWAWKYFWNAMGKLVSFVSTLEKVIDWKVKANVKKTFLINLKYSESDYNAINHLLHLNFGVIIWNTKYCVIIVLILPSN